jgi:hypothetical protein
MAKVPVHELRKLMLPLETAVDAVLELDSEQGGSMAFGMIVEAQIESEPEPGLVLAVQRRGSESIERRKFTLPVLAAAFIRYCWKCRIPLPRHGSKRIEIAPEGFVFTIEGSVEVIRRHGPLPQGQPSATRRDAQQPSASAAKPAESPSGVDTKPAPLDSAAGPPPGASAGSPAPAAREAGEASKPPEQAVA